ncbi:MAG: radical SAM protein [Bacteroidales bacterium]|jgi:histone acetyltransferase (RNA polymerase elongator complex component)|nr:radical SAM protein [Bacteroidales bacterium]
MRHYNIPFFIPELGCPHQCVFCDQHRISGTPKVPRPKELSSQVEAYLATFPDGEKQVEIAFFGGNFTGLLPEEQEAYLAATTPWLRDGKVQGIRLSTRPDYISRENLELLKRFGVSSIELGAQSMDEEVLRLSGRGHTARQVEEAASLILAHDFRLGLQMMTGLPGDTKEKTLFTARRIVELGAVETRIYPTLVIEGTHLAKLYREGSYEPLNLEETVERCKHLVLIFEQHKVKILRLGLHPSEGLINGNDLLAGPFHSALKEVVETAIWGELFREAYAQWQGTSVCIRVSPKALNAAIGHHASNRKWLEQVFKKVNFNADPALKGREYRADPC